MNFSKYISSVLVFILLNSVTVFAQNNNENELALEYFNKKEFSKAVEIYQKLYDKTNSDVHFKYLIKCYSELKDFKSAEKIVRKKIKSMPEDLTSYVILGSLMLEQDKKDDAQKQFETAIDNIKVNENQVTDLGNAFIQIKAFDYAERCFLKGRKLFADYGFYTELAQLYFETRNFKGMVTEYINLLDYNDVFIENVQSQMQSLIVYDADGTIKNIFREELIRRIQKNPDKLVFNEMLIWFFIQEKEFAMAYTQAIAMDKRFKEEGGRIFELGTIAQSNSDYKIAQQCFQYIIDKGNSFGYYWDAKNEILSTNYLLLTTQSEINHADLQSLLEKYNALINESGITNKTIKNVREYASLLCFYNQSPSKAIEILEQVNSTTALSPLEKDKSNILMGDIYIADEDIWEASLIFARVERAHENDPLGYEAKFKRAKIYYYAGEFEYAKTMLDILKASTSKLFSNDAFELSTLINDNTALDTVLDAMKIFSRADLLLYQKKDSLAFLSFDSIPKLFPGHSLEDEITFKKAIILKNKKRYTEAIELFKVVDERFSYDIYGDDACFSIAELYDQVLNDQEKAMEYYKKIISKHQDSIYINLARSRYRYLKEKSIN